MRIRDEFLQCVVYIYPDEESANDGEKAGGSGFFVQPSWADKQSSANIFVVTNRHVVEPMKDPVLRVNLKSGGLGIIRTNGNRWYNHPNGDDISALHFHAFSNEHDIAYIHEEGFLTSSDIAEYNIGIGDSVAMIGRLVGHDGKLRNSPTARFGSISMMPGEKVPNKFNREQETFLVECHSIPGFSGSPVLLVLNSNTRSAGGHQLIGVEPALMGIDWMHVHDKEPVRTLDGNTMKGGLFVNLNSGVAGVIPVWKITELLNAYKAT